MPVPDEPIAHVAYRAVLLAAGLLLVGLLFRQLVTLLLAILITVIVAIPLAAAATRLQRRGVPRAMGALAALLGGGLALSLVVYLLIPPFVNQSDEFVADVPRVVDDLETLYADLTGEDPGQVGDRIQEFVEKWTEDPERLIGPITSIGINVAGVLAALLLILITAYYMAVRPEPLVNGLISLFPPNRLLVRRERGERLAAVAAVNHEGLEAVQVAATSGVMNVSVPRTRSTAPTARSDPVASRASTSRS